MFRPIGYDNGYSYGYGNGDGYGYGYGNGYSHGYGDGDGYGYGNGDGYGDGYGTCSPSPSKCSRCSSPAVPLKMSGIRPYGTALKPVDSAQEARVQCCQPFKRYQFLIIEPNLDRALTALTRRVK